MTFTRKRVISFYGGGHTGSGGLKVGNFLKMLTCELDGVRSREMPG